MPDIYNSQAAPNGSSIDGVTLAIDARRACRVATSLALAFSRLLLGAAMQMFETQRSGLPYRCFSRPFFWSHPAPFRFESGCVERPGFGLNRKYRVATRFPKVRECFKTTWTALVPGEEVSQRSGDIEMYCWANSIAVFGSRRGCSHRNREATHHLTRPALWFLRRGNESRLFIRLR